MCIIIRALRAQTDTVALENKGADQPVHLHSLVSAFTFRILVSKMALLLAFGK